MRCPVVRYSRRFRWVCDADLFHPPGEHYFVCDGRHAR